jgi:hypothetical protein
MFLSVQSLVSASASTPGLPAPVAAAPSPTVSLDVDQVLRHVGRLMIDADLDACLARLVDAADTCGQLVGARKQLCLALNLQHHVDGVVQVAIGREQRRPAPEAERDALRAVAAQVQACMDEAQRRWRRAGRHFTQVTHLLPTQFDIRLALPPPLSAAKQQALMGHFVRTGTTVPAERFEDALASYAAAHRRCQPRVAPAIAARERRRRAGLECGAGLAPLSVLAIAMFEEFLSRQSLLVAESERAGAHHVLHLLADLRSFGEA